jgi:hypothetical protein
MEWHALRGIVCLAQNLTDEPSRRRDLVAPARCDVCQTGLRIFSPPYVAKTIKLCYEFLLVGLNARFLGAPQSEVKDDGSA